MDGLQDLRGFGESRRRTFWRSVSKIQKKAGPQTQTLLLTPILGCQHTNHALANREIDTFNASDSNRL
jgi:hypothetical protein